MKGLIVLILAGCSTTPPCVTTPSPSVEIVTSGRTELVIPSRTTRVCPSYMTVDK